MSLTRETLTRGLLKREKGEPGDHSLVILTAEHTASQQQGGMMGIRGQCHWDELSP